MSPSLLVTSHSKLLIPSYSSLIPAFKLRGSGSTGSKGAMPEGLRWQVSLVSSAFPSRETLIKSLSDFTLEFLCIARNNLTRIASYLRKAMTKLCIKILVESDSAI